MVAVTREVIIPDLQQEAQGVTFLQDQLKGSYQGDIADQFVFAVQNELDVKTYPEAIDLTLGALPE